MYAELVGENERLSEAATYPADEHAHEDKVARLTAAKSSLQRNLETAREETR